MKHFNNLFYKETFVNKQKFVGLVDTGSECTLIKQDVAEKLKLKFEPTQKYTEVIYWRRYTD